MKKLIGLLLVGVMLLTICGTANAGRRHRRSWKNRRYTQSRVTQTNVRTARSYSLHEAMVEQDRMNEILMQPRDNSHLYVVVTSQPPSLQADSGSQSPPSLQANN